MSTPGNGLNTDNLLFSDLQKRMLSSRADALQGASPFYRRGISQFNPPADSNPLIVTPNPFPNYPAPGAGPIPVISYTVPLGMFALITKLAIINYGGAFADGAGNVVWRVLKNGGGIRGISNLTSQVGTYAQPNDTVITLIENDVLQVTVEVPNGQPAMPAGSTTAARFHGFTLPLAEATSNQAAQPVITQ